MSAAKRKGTAWESALVTYLAERFGGRYGLAPRRVAQEGFLDTGDLHGIAPYIGQAKAYRSWEEAIRLGLDGAQAQKARAGEPFGVALVKRVRKGVGAGYAVLTIEDWADSLLRLRRAEALLAEHAPDAARAHLVEIEAGAERTG